MSTAEPARQQWEKAPRQNTTVYASQAGRVAARRMAVVIGVVRTRTKTQSEITRVPRARRVSTQDLRAQPHRRIVDVLRAGPATPHHAPRVQLGRTRVTTEHRNVHRATRIPPILRKEANRVCVTRITNETAPGLHTRVIRALTVNTRPGARVIVTRVKREPTRTSIQAGTPM